MTSTETTADGRERLPAPTPSNVLEDLGREPDERTDGLDGYAVKLSVFEGPLDLQYLETIGLMQDLNLDVAAEYLVMAATLALIKSRMLLPDESPEDEEERDPRAELVQRLLEYQRFKEAAETLSKRRLLGRDVFSVVGPGPERTPDGEREIEVGLFELVAAFKTLLDQVDSTGLRHEIESEHVTVRDRMMDVMEILEKNESIEFMQIFRGADGEDLPSRPVLVATFLAILELARLAALRIYQGLSDRGTPEGAIRVRRATIPGDGAEWRDHIRESM